MKFRLRLLLVAFAVSFLLVGALAFISIIRFSQLNNRVALVEHSYKVSNIINVLEQDVRELDKAEFRFLITHDSSYLAGFNKFNEQVRVSTDTLKSLTADNPAQQQYAVLFESDVALYLADADRTRTALEHREQVWTSEEYQNSKQLMNSAANRLAEMAAAEYKLLEERTNERQFYTQVTTKMLWALTVVFSIFTLGLFYLLLRELKKRIAYQNELQQKVGEIARSKRELEHIAYATSHDLQEPLRKIRILSDKWFHQHKSDADANSRATLDRVVAAATRMQSLVTELMILTSLGDNGEVRACPLKDYVREAMAELDGVIKEKEAVINIGALPVIGGYPDQLRLLFKSLLDNALKFAKPGVPLVVDISSREAEGSELEEDANLNQRYYCVTIQDNGVGFDNKMVEKMFGIFRQLHSSAEGYKGKGAGLAICQRIMGNHKGQIVAHGFPDVGATFKLYFPINN